jgi:hypothetical protein
MPACERQPGLGEQLGIGNHEATAPNAQDLSVAW